MRRAARTDGVLLEAHIERTCTDWLALDGWTALVTDPPQLRGLGVSEPGIPDKQYRRPFGTAWKVARDLRQCPIIERALVQVMWVEWKRINKCGKATKTSQRQDEWHAAEQARGFLTLRAGIDFPATIEGFQEFYRNSGLMRLKI